MEHKVHISNFIYNKQKQTNKQKTPILTMPRFKFIILLWFVSTCYVIFGFYMVKAIEITIITQQVVTNKSKLNNLTCCNAVIHVVGFTPVCHLFLCNNDYFHCHNHVKLEQNNLKLGRGSVEVYRRGFVFVQQSKISHFSFCNPHFSFSNLL